MHKVFISYHHDNDQRYKEDLVTTSNRYEVFIDRSVDTGDISDDMEDQTIREKIRDEYLRDSSVTILLIGTGTKNRRHIDWEIYSSMIDGKVNKKSGILVVNLPSTGNTNFTAAHESEKPTVYPECQNWISINERAEYERRYPYVPDRIIDNLLKKGALVSVTTWSKVCDPNNLRLLIDTAYEGRQSCEYDLSRQMKRRNS